MNWQHCVDAMTDADCQRLATERHIDVDFFRWLHGKKLIGLSQGCVAFPIVDGGGNVVGAHVRSRPIWTYEWFVADEKRQHITPFIIGNHLAPQRIMVFESQWDMFAVMAAYRVHRNPAMEAAFFFVATRGAGNGKLIKGLFQTHQTAYAFKQNDPPRFTGEPTPADRWVDDIALNAGCPVKSVQTPEPHKDPNDWVKGGGTISEIHQASTVAVLVPMPSPKKKLPAKFPGWGDDDDAPEMEVRDFPTDMLPLPYAEMVRGVARTVGVTERLSGPITLAVISASIGRALSAELIPGKVTRGNIFLLCGANSGVGKSETGRPIVKPLMDVQYELKDQWAHQVSPRLKAVQDVLTAEVEALRKKIKKELQERDALIVEIAQKKKELQKIEDDLTEPKLIIEDATIQKMAIDMAKNGETMALLSMDGGDVIRNLLGRYNPLETPDDGIFLKAYSGDPLSVDRIGRPPVMMKSPCLMMGVLVQPDKIDDLLRERRLTDGGFLPRCLLVREDGVPTEIDPKMPPIPEEVIRCFDQAIRELVHAFRLAPKQVRIPVAPEARELMVSYFNEVVKQRRIDLRDIETYAARFAEQACRLCIVLHAAHSGARAGDCPIDTMSASRAITVGRWFADEQLRVLDIARRQVKRALRQKIWLVAANSPLGFTVRDLQLARITSSADHGRLLLDELVQKGHLQKELRPTKGRTAEVYTLSDPE
jgi:hypothetical protein